MKLQVEHFLYGQFNGFGVQLIKTDGVSSLLKSKHLEMLCHQYEKTDKPLYTRLSIEGEIWVAYSYIAPRKDEYGRPSIWNHTFIMKLDESERVHTPLPPKELEPRFITELEKPPKFIVPLQIEVAS